MTKILKINIIFEMRIYQCTPVPNFSQFGALQFFETKFAQKDHRKEFQDKLNLRITYLSKNTIIWLISGGLG